MLDTQERIALTCVNPQELSSNFDKRPEADDRAAPEHKPVFFRKSPQPSFRTKPGNGISGPRSMTSALPSDLVSVSNDDHVIATRTPDEPIGGGRINLARFTL